jgi:chromosome partitioning protein
MRDGTAVICNVELTPPQTVIIAVCNQKGGTGKTTTTINIGCALAMKKKKVLLIDLDPQGNLSYSLGIADGGKELSGVFTNTHTLQDTIITKEGMDIVPSSMDLADIELSLQGATEREFLLKKMLQPFRAIYDYILIDCSPSLTLLSVNALCAADKVIVPFFPDVLSLEGVRHITKTTGKIRQSVNKNLEMLAAIAVNVDERKKITHEVIAFMRQHSKVSVLRNYVRTSAKCTEAPSHGKSVLSYAPKSNSAKDYIQVTKELLTLLN